MKNIKELTNMLNEGLKKREKENEDLELLVKKSTVELFDKLSKIIKGSNINNEQFISIDIKNKNSTAISLIDVHVENNNLKLLNIHICFNSASLETINTSYDYNRAFKCEPGALGACIDNRKEVAEFIKNINLEDIVKGMIDYQKGILVC